MRILGHIFPVEVGRSENILKDNRFCSLCYLDVGPDSDRRKPFIKQILVMCPIFTVITGKEKVKCIINCSEERETLLAG